MYKIKRIITTDSETYYDGCTYDGDRYRLLESLNRPDMIEIYDKNGSTTWVKPANIVAVDLYKDDKNG